MKRVPFLIILLILIECQVFCQGVKDQGALILFQGLILDANNEAPIANAQIFINRSFTSVSDKDGKFAFYTSRNDTVTFRMLGYKQAVFNVSDTLRGKEFVAGIYMHSDTVSIAEVIIIPMLAGLKSDLLNPRPPLNREAENAKNNLAISAYQARVNQDKLGDAATNYAVLKERQWTEAYTRGQIPPDRIVGLNPLLLLPAAYLLIHGLPQKPPPPQPVLTDQEVNELHKKYLESLRKR